MRYPQRKTSWLLVGRRGVAIHSSLLDCDGDVFVLNIEPQPVEEAHVHVGDPNQRKPGDQIAAPASVEHLEARNYEEKRSHIVAKAVLACEEIEKFARDQGVAVLAAILAPVPGLAKDLFVCDGPRDTGNGKRQDKKIRKLDVKGHRHSVFNRRAYSEMRPGGLGLQHGLEEQTDTNNS